MQTVQHELPATAIVVNRFGSFQEDKGCQQQVETDGSISCQCNLCQQWHQFVSGELPGGPDWKQYEVLTQELVKSLAQHIRQGVERRPASLHATAAPLLCLSSRLLSRHACQQCKSSGTVKVLEIGAGDGRLSHYLQLLIRELQQQQTSTFQQHGSHLAGGSCAPSYPHIDFIATDSGAQDLQQHSPYRHEVLLEDCGVALTRHQPHVVLCCWMPLGIDFTAAIRQTPTVQHYVLVGEAGQGICGHAWLTWGNPEAYTPPQKQCSTQPEDDNPPMPPWQQDGFAMHHLRDISAQQLCRLDKRWSPERHSRTYAFTRQQNQHGHHVDYKPFIVE